MTPQPSWSGRLLVDLLFRHWATKIGALALAAILFVFTRDEVTRTFEIPLRVVADPRRVLLTDLPDTIQVQVRGPWTRVNRLQDYDLGAASLDLEEAEPGPLEIDRASIVMPPGVVLAGMHYDHVDLRFDPVVERAVAVVPNILGQPAPDHRLVRIEAEPPRWPVRGGRTQVQGLQQLTTEPFDLKRAADTLEVKLALVRPGGNVRLVGDGRESPKVTVRAVVEPVLEERELTVPVEVPESLDPTGAVPPTHQVVTSGPLPAFRELDALGLAFPVEAEVVPLAGEDEGARTVEVRFRWAEEVPEAVSEALSFEHGVVRVVLPPRPSSPSSDAP